MINRVATTQYENRSNHNHNSYKVNQQCKQDSRKDVIPSKIWLSKSQILEMKIFFLLLEIKRKTKSNKENKSPSPINRGLPRNP